MTLVDLAIENAAMQVCLGADSWDPWEALCSSCPHPLYFGDRDNRLIWLILDRMHASKEPMSMITVASTGRKMSLSQAVERLRMMTECDRSGGLDSLRYQQMSAFRVDCCDVDDESIVEAVGGMASIMARIGSGYITTRGITLDIICRKLREAYRARRIHYMATSWCADLSSVDGLSAAPRIISEMAKQAESCVADDVTEPRKRGQCLSAWLDNDDLQLEYCSWGVAALQKLIKLHTMHYCTLAAYPATGKTGLALQLADATGKWVGEPGAVLMISLEMPELMLNARWASMETGVDSQAIIEKRISVEESLRIKEVLADWDKRQDVIIRDTSTDYTIEGIVRAIASHKRRYPALRLVIIDHIGLVDSGGADMFATISAAARNLRIATNRHGVCILGLCQFSRDSSKKADHERETKLSLLRGSQEIENSSTSILLMDRVSHDEPPPYKIRIKLAKNNFGPTGEAVVMFDPRTQRFDSPAMPSPSAGGRNERYRCPVDDGAEDLFP